jgi:hypothetical protein
MQRIIRSSILLGLVTFVPEILAQLQPPPFPLSVDQNAFLYKTYSNYTVYTPPLINWQSKRGVPITTNASDPGSDGLSPTLAQQISYGTNYPRSAPSPGQFRGFVSIAAVPVQGATSLNPNTSFAHNVQGLKWPRLETNNVVVAILRASQVGAPYLAKQSSFAFGSIIPPPLTDEHGVGLTNNPNYWLAAPYSAGGTNVRPYYYSPYANSVFATQPGQVSIVWEKSVPTFTQPTNLPPFVGWVQQGPNYYILYTNSYLVSGEAVKTPQTIYWTEGSRSAVGHPVVIPQAVTANIIYNINFPQNAPAPGDTGAFVNPSNATSTLWVDAYHQLRADNLSGRAFMELIGPQNANGTVPFLGFEIVDVYSDPAPIDINVELGTRIPAYQDRRDDSALFVSPPQGETKFYYRQSIPNSDNVTLWATYETTNLNDFEAFWLIPGVAALQWPYLFDRYHEYWPSDIGDYVNYVRPYVSTPAEAALTGVQLPPGEVPTIPYQDDPNNPRAIIVNGLFYTYLDPSFPAHRSLLQFLSGNNVAYERVFSWLDANLQATNFAGSVATNLTEVAAHPTNLALYQSNYAQYQTNVAQYPTAYSNYLAALPRGVNGTWQLGYEDLSGIIGSVSTCAVIIVTADMNGVLATNEFDGPGFPIVSGGIDFSSVQVTGITNAVVDVLLAYNGFVCNDPQGLLLLALSPANPSGDILTYLDAPPTPVNAPINLTFDDQAANPAYAFSVLVSGSYLPDESIMADLVLPAPTPPAIPVPPTPPTLWADQSIAPRIVTATANVGDRIYAPSGELGAVSNYLAGYILQTNGNSFNPGAYLDPFAFGFALANQGAIIPVNAVPGQNLLEVWWFRQDNANVAQGFLPSYWPSVVGRYTLQWPAGADEIILASNAGSGPLASLQAKGGIYRQPDPTQPGYNPNEEQAIMLGGQAYALHDDLNITNAGPNYSSQPYVLINYTESDGRPAMHAFHVRREKPEAGILFDYVVNAGTFLQAPMPLPLLEAPVEGVGSKATNYNGEPSATSGDLPALPATLPAYYGLFTFQDRKNEFWVYRGLHHGLPPLQVGAYNSTSNTFGSLPPATAVVGQPFAYYIHTSRLLASGSLTMILTNFLGGPNLPSDFQLVVETDSSGGPLAFAISGTPTSTNEVGAYNCSIVTQDTGDNSIVTNSLVIDVVASGIEMAQGPLAITSTNQYSGQMVTFSNRPPFLAQAPVPTNSFTMRFYYKNQATFDWPGRNNPGVGAIVPYLLPRGSTVDPTVKTSASLDIVYRPVWPTIVNSQPIPTLQSGQTLTDPINGLAAVRGQSSVQVLYQQSMATNTSTSGNNHSVTLFDPTVQKRSSLLAQGLSGLPASVYSVSYQGRNYFPNLPPNLVNRIYFDPNTTSLVFQGQYVNPGVGSAYLLLNVLTGSDLAAVENLCPSSDTANSGPWASVVTNLSVEIFMEDLDTNGNYNVDPTLTQTNYASQLVAVTNSDQQVDSYAMSANGPGLGYITYIVGNTLSPAHAGEPITVYIARIAPALYPGALEVLSDPNPLSENISFQHSDDLAGNTSNYQYDWRIIPPADGLPPTTDPSTWTPLTPVGTDISHFTLGAASGIESLGDNYVALRYREIDPLANPANTNWSTWTAPVLAEGYIKRVLQGINPFDQRTTDLFNNPANTTGSIISQAGHRWEGDVALNASTITNAGLIEIYETVLHRGEALSINAGYNYGPANDALLLAAGYLSDLYSFVANDALADEANPTIGIGTADKTYGDVATALFSFQGQEPSLLEEELALLRGRDDSLSPGVRLAPVYNRLYWNYTYGIAAGEVIYALNYNILDENNDGVVNAADAAILFPMGHGDAYGHLLTAMGNYYSLLMNPNFDWVPQAETVTVLGAAVSVNYEHERKFAATAGSLANTGLRVFDLTWREGYRPGTGGGWSYFDATQTSGNTYSNLAGGISPVTRYWGMDHWAARTAQGTYLNWVVGNAILPPVDPDPTHQGIQKVDRTTVTDLNQLPQTASQLQTDMDNADAGFTPFDLAQNAIPFDINPLLVTGTSPQTHFEQIYQRAVVALNNAVTAFNDAQNVTQLMRSEEDSLSDFQAGVTSQELAYNNQLIELYGSPYPDDMGPGKTYAQDYNGPDLLHYTYVEMPDTNNFNGILPDPTTGQTFYLDVQLLPSDWSTNMYSNVNFLAESTDPSYTNNTNFSVPLYIGPDGFFDKPPSWTSLRSSPGQIQQAISSLVGAQHALRQAAYNAIYDKIGLDKSMNAFSNQIAGEAYTVALGNSNLQYQSQINNIQLAYSIADEWIQFGVGVDNDIINVIENAIPDFIGTSVDLGKLAKSPAFIALNVVKWAALGLDAADFTASQAVMNSLMDQINSNSISIANSQLDTDTKNAVLSIGAQETTMQGDLTTISQDLRTVSDAQAAYQALVAKGLRIQSNRQTFRQHAAALVQGFRTRDAAFRLFQNEKLQRYLTLVDLAAKYAYLAAQAYDYETGLLSTPQGQAFLNQIISAQAIGIVNNGAPQYSSSSDGDPGLAGALAQMDGDWQVLKGRLGFNNPDGYGTTVSLRSENYRILTGTNGDSAWQAVLQHGRVADLLADSDVKRNCLQIDDGSGQPVPGIILTFSTTIANSQNLFGNQLAAGDHNFSPSSFATKIFAAGVCFDGYIGMDNPAIGGGVTPPDPTLDPNALAATPYVYLIPVGQDSMRSPPLGDTSTIRSWNVDDVAIPLPFNVSASDFSSNPFYTSANSLSEPLFAMREHQAFRPVSSTTVFNTSIYGATGALQPSQYTNNRLIGRSIWNSKWKLVIPGRTLLADPNQGLDSFIQTVKDVHLYFITYSYSGN